MTENLVTINSRKYDGEIHKSWTAQLLSETDELLTFVGSFKTEINHGKIGVIRRGTISYEYYWKNKWFNVFRFHEPEGDLRNFYCNLNTLPVLSNRILDYVDLDIDVLIWHDFSYEILDIDEFEFHALKYNYPKHVREKVFSTLEELLSMLEQKEFPFDYKF